MCIWGGFTLTARLNALWQISAWDIVALRFSLAFLILMPILLYRKEAAFTEKRAFYSGHDWRGDLLPVCL